MKISEAVAALMVAAAVGIAVYLPSPQNPPALVHVERIHVMEPGEDIFKVARRYFKEQQEFDNVNRYIYAVRVANGLDKTFKPGDRVIIPLAILGESLEGRTGR